MKKRLVVAACLCAGAAFAYLPTATPASQGVDPKGIAAWVDASCAELDSLHGFVLVRHGKVVAEGYWAPYSRDRTHMLYSHSKSFTSTAVGFLVDEGKLDIDERVATIFPDRLPANPSENLLRMRVRDLLTMNTGSEKDSIGPVSAAPDGDWVRAFLAHPVERQPGTYFVYNTGATYMLAAIVEKRTGEKLMDYLGRKLFTPLGITDAWTTTCPKGIACGGYGMNMTTRDLALFGQFCLQKGRWNGEQLVSEDWLALATAKQTETRRKKTSDWGCGYGFQFWRCLPHGIYRADGARGQYTLMMPEQDAVLSITAGLNDMGKELTLVWKYILPALHDAPLPEDPAADAALAKKCAALAIPTVKGAKSGDVALGRDYSFAANGFKLTGVRVDPTADGWKITWKGPLGDQKVPVGHGAWKYGSMKLQAEPYEALGALVGGQPTASSGAWTAPDTFTCRTYLVGGPSCFDAVFKFSGNNVSVDVKFTAMRRPHHVLQGSAR